jgi:hypothetical protein
MDNGYICHQANLMSRIFRLFFFVGGMAFSSCCMKKNYCHSTKLSIIISGYNRLDVHTIIIKKYKAGITNKAIDSAIFTYAGNDPVVVNKKDTLQFTSYSTNSSTINGIYAGNDWAVYLPSARENYLITGIGEEDHTFEKIKCTDHSSTCFNPINYFTVNGAWKKDGVLWIEKKK